MQINTLKDSVVVSNVNVVPSISYKNADVYKDMAIKHNRGKSGVYRWINKETGESYVGSSINLSKRFNQYFNYSHISDPKRNMRIYRALLKYGYSKFELQILEYCDTCNVIGKEQYYLDLLKPEYNILLKAGSRLGFKHSEQTILKMKGSKSPETLQKIRSHLKILNSTPFPTSIRAKISAGMAKFNVLTKGKKIVFINLETDEKLFFDSIRDASLNMKISRNTISKYILSQRSYGKYIITFADK